MRIIRGVTTTPTTRNRPSLAAADRDLARQIGSRIRAHRSAAGLTQRELAQPRYTKAYISALLFSDATFCHQICEVLKKYYGHTLEEIGGLDLSGLL